MLRCVLERPDEPERLGAVNTVGDGDVGERHLTGGDGAVLSSTIVSIRRVRCSSHHWTTSLLACFDT